MKARPSFTAGSGLRLWAVLVLVVLAATVAATVGIACEEHQFRGGPWDLSWIEKDECFLVWSGPGQYAIDGQAHEATIVCRMHMTGKKLVGYITITTDETGDQIYYTAEMTRSSTHSSDWFGTYTITGGTGKFANATGSGTDGLPTDTYPGGAIGTICY